MNTDAKLLLYAKHYYNLGLNVTCISNTVTEYNFYDTNVLKAPYHKWKYLKLERQPYNELLSYDWDKATGLGTVAGFYNLVTLDIDGCANYDFIQDLLIILGLPNNYEWVVQSGSLDGFHIYVYTDKRLEDVDLEQAASTYPPNNDNLQLFEKLELLWNTHVVLPPSLHSSGGEYSFVNCKYPQNIPIKIDVARISCIIELFLNRRSLEKKVIYSDTSPFLHQPSDLDKVNLGDVRKNLYFIFDIETDGLIGENSYPNILQISWIIMDVEGIVYKKVTELIKGDYNFNLEAFRINKISLDIINKLGKNPNDVYSELMLDLKYCDYIVAHNLDFDYNVLKNEIEKYNVKFPQKEFKKICTMKLNYRNKENIGIDKKYPSLTELYEFLFKTKTQQIHNAQSDVMILSKCFREIILRHRTAKL